MLRDRHYFPIIRSFMLFVQIMNKNPVMDCTHSVAFQLRNFTLVSLFARFSYCPPKEPRRLSFLASYWNRIFSFKIIRLYIVTFRGSSCKFPCVREPVFFRNCICYLHLLRLEKTLCLSVLPSACLFYFSQTSRWICITFGMWIVDSAYICFANWVHSSTKPLI
jgi:hypothetical protein